MGAWIKLVFAVFSELPFRFAIFRNVVAASFIDFPKILKGSRKFYSKTKLTPQDQKKDFWIILHLRFSYITNFTLPKLFHNFLRFRKGNVVFPCFWKNLKLWLHYKLYVFISDITISMLSCEKSLLLSISFSVNLKLSESNDLLFAIFFVWKKISF